MTIKKCDTATWYSLRTRKQQLLSRKSSAQTMPGVAKREMSKLYVARDVKHRAYFDVLNFGDDANIVADVHAVHEILKKTSSVSHKSTAAHVTYHTSHVTLHTSHFTRHTSHATRHTSNVTRHTSHITRHRPNATSHIQVPNDPDHMGSSREQYHQGRDASA